MRAYVVSPRYRCVHVFCSCARAGCCMAFRNVYGSSPPGSSFPLLRSREAPWRSAASGHEPRMGHWVKDQLRRMAYELNKKEEKEIPRAVSALQAAQEKLTHAKTEKPDKRPVKPWMHQPNFSRNCAGTWSHSSPNSSSWRRTTCSFPTQPTLQLF